MKPFDLEKAIAGHPLITRNGVKVSEFYYFVTAKEDTYPCIAVVDESKETFTIEGRLNIDCESGYDLFLDSVKKTYWINIYNNGHIHVGNVHKTKIDAELSKEPGYITTISFELEE